MPKTDKAGARSYPPLRETRTDQRLIVRPFALHATVELHDRIVGSTYPADRLMQAFFKERNQLGKRDRGFIAETVYGMLRNRRWLEWAFADLDTMHRVLAYLAIHQPDASPSSYHAPFPARLHHAIPAHSRSPPGRPAGPVDCAAPPRSMFEPCHRAPLEQLVSAPRLHQQVESCDSALH